MTSNYYPLYNMNDMNEYNSFFEKNYINKSYFIGHLNDIMNPDNIVCDFNSVLSFIREFSVDTYKYIKNHLVHPSDYYIWYFYFKFLLLDNESKDNFYHKYLIKLCNFKSYILYGFTDNPNKTNKSHVNDILKNIYEYIHFDDELNIFIDYKDNYRNYQRLDISKKINIQYKSDIYLNNYTKSLIFHFIHNYQSIQLLYHFISYRNIYIIEFDNIRNGLETFINHFNLSIDKYIIMYHFITNTYTDSKKYDITITKLNSSIIDKIKTNLYKDYSKIENYNNDEDNFNIIIKLFRYVFFDMNNNDIRLYFNKYIDIFLNEDKQNIEHILEYIKPDPFDNGLFLYKRYMAYCNSKLMDGLTFMRLQVYSCLIDNKYLYLNEDLQELKEYLETIFKEYNFEYYTRFDYIR